MKKLIETFFASIYMNSRLYGGNFMTDSLERMLHYTYTAEWVCDSETSATFRLTNKDDNSVIYLEFTLNSRHIVTGCNCRETVERAAA